MTLTSAFDPSPPFSPSAPGAPLQMKEVIGDLDVLESAAAIRVMADEDCLAAVSAVLPRSLFAHTSHEHHGVIPVRRILAGRFSTREALFQTKGFGVLLQPPAMTESKGPLVHDASVGAAGSLSLRSAQRTPF